MGVAHYTGNAIYDRLLESPSDLLPPGSAWPLIYGSASGEPLALVVACRISRGSNEPQVNRAFLGQAHRLAQTAGIPFRFLGFRDDAGMPQSFIVTTGPGQGHKVMSTDGWRNELLKIGIGTAGAASKPINRAGSSGYHMWQRTHLGSIRVVDIDLLRVPSDGGRCEVIELKRSSIPISSWAPFSADQPNFELMARFCARADTDFLLAFNEYDKQTLQDDLSQIKLFSYGSSGFSPLGVLDWDGWVTGAPRSTVARPGPVRRPVRP